MKDKDIFHFRETVFTACLFSDILAKVTEERKEFEKALYQAEGLDAILDEAWDNVQVYETLIRKVCRATGRDPRESKAAMVRKNMDRNYYRTPSPPIPGDFIYHAHPSYSWSCGEMDGPYDIPTTNTGHISCPACLAKREESQ